MKSRLDILKQISVAIKPLAEYYKLCKEKLGISDEMLYTQLLRNVCKFQIVEVVYKNYSSYWNIRENDLSIWTSICKDYMKELLIPSET